MKCKKCKKQLKIVEKQKKEYNFRNGSKEVIVRNIYNCTNPDCEDYQRFAYPDCEHEFNNKDYGGRMFEHCYYCPICGYFYCVDSSG